MQMKLFLKYLFFNLLFLYNFNFEIYKEKRIKNEKISKLINGK
jgi:hypothetical protein